MSFGMRIYVLIQVIDKISLPSSLYHIKSLKVPFHLQTSITFKFKHHARVGLRNGALIISETFKPNLTGLAR